MAGALVMDTIKFRLQLSMPFEQALLRLIRVQNALARTKRTFVNRARTLGYALHANAKVRLHQAQYELASLKRILTNKARALGYALHANARVGLHQAQHEL